MKTRSIYFLSRVLLVLILWTATGAQPAHAATTWVVNSLGDSSGGGICTLGDCTLRSAINTAASGDTITFAASVIGTIHLNFGGLTIAKNLTIRGPGAYVLTVAGVVNNSSIFRVNAGISLNLSRLSIIHGRNLSGGGILILSGGTLTLDQCSFFDNYSNEDGAVLYNHGTVTITRCYFGDNHAGTAGEGFGGAIENNEDGVMSISNSTFTLNGATEGGAIDNMGSLSITNSTIKDNGAITAGGVINEPGGSATLKNVLLADNIGGNCSGLLADGSTHNLSTDDTCPPGFTQVVPADLALGALVGIPAYFPLNVGSVAIDAGTNDGCPAIDEQGKPRPLDGNNDGIAVCDVGAYEAWPINFIPRAYLPLVIHN